jgi:dolichol kinase
MHRAFTMTRDDVTSNPSKTWISGIIAAIAVVILLQVILARFQQSPENRRHLQHAATGQLLIGISYLLPLVVCQVALSLGIALLLYVFSAHKAWYKSTFGPLLRPHELENLPGAFWFLVGTLICALTMDLSVGRYAVLCLSYADPVAAWVGRSIASPQITANTTIAGSIGCFSIALLTGYGVLGTNIMEIMVGALACTLAEAFPVGNDNLLIPIVTGASIHILRTANKFQV